jgi:hypothetical protein
VLKSAFGLKFPFARFLPRTLHVKKIEIKPRLSNRENYIEEIYYLYSSPNIFRVIKKDGQDIQPACGI